MPETEKTYIGVKIVKAWPEARDYKDGYAVRYEDGYISWSPKKTFERAYRLVTPGERELLA